MTADELRPILENIKEGSFDKLMHNIEHSDKQLDPSFLFNGDSDTIILGGFDWFSAPEGHAYWYEIWFVLTGMPKHLKL